MENKKEVKKKRKYNFAEIRELQSKLTLVAGEKQRENKEIIEQFDEVNFKDIYSILVQHNGRGACH